MLKFEEANRKIKANEENRRLDPDGWQMMQESNDALRSKIIAEIVEYEALVAHDPDKPVVLGIENLGYLSDLLIKARIAFKITHKELASFLRCTEEQTVAFEDKDYQNASYVDFLTAMNALGIKHIICGYWHNFFNVFLDTLFELLSIHSSSCQVISETLQISLQSYPSAITCIIWLPCRFDRL